MKILDTLGKTKKAIGGVVAICILAAVIFLREPFSEESKVNRKLHRQH